MALATGKQLGSYEILAAIGKGGMGEVYRARDTRLDRDVAIKTLPEEFEKDANRLARFEREAKLLASLNHPHIAAIYGLEKYEGNHLLVLELVEGVTLYVSIYDLSTTSPLRRLTFGGDSRFPIWSGDSQFVAFQSDRDGDPAIFMQRADGSSQAERLTTPQPGVSHVPESWSRDGRTLLFSAKKDDTFSLWTLSLANKQVMPFGNVQSVEPIVLNWFEELRQRVPTK